MIEEERKGAPAYRMKLKRTNTSSNIFGRVVAKHILKKPHHEHDHYADHFNWHPNCHPESGGPPYVTLIMVIICTTYYFKYNVNCDKEKLLERIFILSQH
eukprot:UN03402